MSEILDEAEALVQCKVCQWYKACVLPMRVTEADLRKQLESTMPGAAGQGAPQEVSQFLSGMAAAAQNSLLEGCPIFIGRLRSNPKLAERIKRLMQSWSEEGEAQNGKAG